MTKPFLRTRVLDRWPRLPVGLLLMGLVVAAAGCGGAEPPAEESAPAPSGPVTALPPMNAPADNPITPEKVALGAQLFFDTRISDSGEFSCETCHRPEMGWGDGLALSTNAAGNVNTRHSPTLYNVGYYTEFYWDGRMPTLEAQVLAAWRGQVGATPEKVAETIGAIPAYAEQFQSAMGTAVTGDAIVAALSTFIRSLAADDAPWDRYELGDESAVSAEVVAGFDVFSLSCTLCHTPPLYTDLRYNNIGVGFDAEMPDLGRGAFLARQDPPPDDAASFNGAFKTPTLRNVALHPPYFHNGSAATLEEAVDYILSGGHANEWMSDRMQARELTPEERTQLLAFLNALTSTNARDFVRPALPE